MTAKRVGLFAISTFAIPLFVFAVAEAQTGQPVNIRDKTTGTAATVSTNHALDVNVMTLPAGGGMSTVNQGAPNTPANGWPVTLSSGGSATIGTVANPLPVSGSFAVTSVAGTVTVAGTVAVSSVAGTVAATQSGVWSVTVAGTVTSNQGTPNSHSNSWPVVLTTGGTGTLGGSTLPIQAAVTNFPATQPVSGTVSVSNFPATQNVAVIGTASTYARVENFPATQPVSGTVSVSNFPATQNVAVIGTASVYARVENFPATQPVSGTVSVNNFPATQNVAVIGTASTYAHVENFPATQAVSAVSLPLPTGASTSANQTNGAQKTQITDAAGHGPVTVKLGGVPAAVADSAAVVAFSPNSPLPTGANTIGTVNQGAATTPAGSWPTQITDRFGAPFNLTPFGDWRVANPYTMTDITNKYELDYRVWGTTTTGGGSVSQNQNQAAVVATVTAANGAHAQLRTNSYFRYQSGKALRWRMSIYHQNAGDANQTRSWGFFDDNDGLFFQLIGTALSIIQRSSVSGSVVNTSIAQASWNVDKMDGTGPSGMTLDVTKGNLYEAALQWLGVGNVQFFIDGFLVHQIKNVNVNTTAYMKTAQLPITMDIVNTAASTGASISNVCVSVVAEGGTVPPALSFGAYNPSDVNIPTTETPLLAIRPKLTFNGIANRMLIVPRNLIAQTSGQRAGWRLLVNPTVTGGSWVSADPESGVEYNITATSFSGGTTLLRGFLPNLQDHDNIDLTNLFDGLDDSRKLHVNAYDTSQDVLLITGQDEAASTTGMRASLAWEEQR
jgi:phage gpG-like protein